ncbi:MAG: hypothetical protein J6C33_08185 [Lachnospiraceae bacterium]|nr:hypothetical protein [Lachnospiraceae bacterium]
MSEEQFQIEIDGLGIIFYSPQSAKHIKEGEDYLRQHYWKPEDVVRHVYDGSIVGIATGTPGVFDLNIYQNTDPDIEKLDPDFALKLCLNVTDQVVYFRDLYVLLRWEKESAEDIKVDMENGCYEVIVCSWIPESGIRGDHQRINLYFNRVETLPRLHYEGVPSLL